MKPWEFEALTVHEFDSMAEAAKLHEARIITLCAKAVAMLLKPYMDKNASVEWTVDGWLGPHFEQQILDARSTRLTALDARETNDEHRS